MVASDKSEDATDVDFRNTDQVYVAVSNVTFCDSYPNNPIIDEPRKSNMNDYDYRPKRGKKGKYLKDWE